MDADERFERLVAALADEPGVIVPMPDPNGRHRWGSDALKVKGRIFAMVVVDRLVLKLPADRVTELVGAGEGERWDAGKGKPLKEWFALDPASRKRWLPLAREAMTFVGR